MTSASKRQKVYRHEISTGHGLDKAHGGPVDRVTILLLSIGIEIADAPDVAPRSRTLPS